MEATPGGADPQLLYAPAQPLKVASDERIPRGTLRRLALAWAAALLAVWIVERVSRVAGDRPARALRRLLDIARARPRSAVLASALIATVLATYPIVFLGRSLVSPNNGGVRMLYDWLPATPGSNDAEVEDPGWRSRRGALGVRAYSNVARGPPGREWPLWNRYRAGRRSGSRGNFLPIRCTG